MSKHKPSRQARRSQGIPREPLAERDGQSIVHREDYRERAGRPYRVQWPALVHPRGNAR